MVVNVQEPNPVIVYHPDGYRTARADLKGRHSAGESFLTAFLTQAQGPEVFGLLFGQAGADEFRKSVAATGRGLVPRVIARTDVPVLKEQGLLYLPQPDIAREAVIRSFVGDKAYSICGVTHTIAARETIDQIARIVVEPIAPWDALICTSKSVHTAVSTIMAHGESDLAARLGAKGFTRPMIPIIPLGVHAERFVAKDGERVSWRAQLGLNDDTIAILFFGRLSFHAKASPLQLAQAAEKAAQRMRRQVAIIWCGWFNDDMQQRAFMGTAKMMAPSVGFHHLDGRDHRTRFTIWSAADIFCTLSDNIQESFGLTVIEAMAAGLPVVASNWNGYRDSIQHGVNGVLVDSYLPQTSMASAAYRYISGLDTYDAYIGGISQFCFIDVDQTAEWFVKLSDPERRRKMGEQARRTVATTFDWRAVMAQYNDLWIEQRKILDAARNDERYGSSITWQRHDPALAFRQYASNAFAESGRLTKGVEYANWDTLPSQPGVVVNPHVLFGQASLHNIKAAISEAPDGIAVADLLARFGANERALVVRSLHWLIKIGLVRYLPSPTATGPPQSG